MLERTSACLDTGVRFSLRQKSLFPKSRRLLHSSFWSTHAPDVHHLCLTHKPESYAPASSCSAAASLSYSPVAPASSTDSHDAPFLDFLYPAPTQAFMTRLSQSERWSRRNTRPNVLRGYSSMTTPKESSSPSLSSPRAYRELVALLESPIPDQSFLALDIERAWNLLSQISSPDTDLLHRLIYWFAERDDRIADQHVLDLFADLPIKSRSPASYRHAILSNLRLGKQGVAVALHTEASVLPKAGPIASDYLMATAISQSDWPLAVSVQKEWETYNAAGSSSSTPLWNRSLADLPFALAQLHQLREHCLKEMRPAETGKIDESTQDVRRLYRSLVHHFIQAQSRQQIFLRPGYSPNLIRGSVRHLIETTHENGLASATLFENILITLLTLKGSASNHECGAIITATYLLYRQSEFFAPTKKLLLFITRYWRDRDLAFGGQRSTTNFIRRSRILDDWIKYHQKPSDSAFVFFMDTFAQRGRVEAVKEHANLYKSFYSNDDLNPDAFWPLVSVHAVNRNPGLAAKQLRTMRKEYGVSPNLRCWNIVLQAYTRADDISGATETFRKMLKSGLEPDEYSYGTLLTSYAKRGDIDGVIEILDLAKTRGAMKPTTYMLNCMILALTRKSEMNGALKALDQTVDAVKQDKANGSLTLCFNTVLTAFAWKRDLRSTMEIYGRMKAENVPLDERSYGALMLVLCLFRQSPSAHKILKTVMPSSGIRAMAFHYAILTRGYLAQEMYSHAIELQREMKKAQVRETPSSRAVAVQANTLYQHNISGNSADEADSSMPLDLAIADFEKVLDDTRVFHHGMQPEAAGHETMDISNLIYIHGKRRSYEAVQHLFQMFQEKLREIDKGSNQAPIILLLTNLMFVHCQAEEWSEVDKYWDLIKSRMDEIRFSHVPASKFVQSIQHNQPTSTLREGESALIPVSYSMMLSQPLQYYIQSQFAQSSIRKLVPQLTELLSQGFRFANKTWNELIVQLCQASPPRALLAYTLVEKHMMKDWPGWIQQGHGAIVKPEIVFLKKQTLKEGLQYINARYISKETVIPQYRTMVHLARAMLDVRGLTSRGLGDDHNESGEGLRELRRQVGTIPEIREQAPRTVHAIQSMPRILDRLQGSLLRAD